MPRRGSDAGSAAPLKFIRIDDGCCLYTLHSRSRTPIPRRAQETTQVALCVWVHLQRPKTQAGTKDLGNEPSTAPLHRKRGVGREAAAERVGESELVREPPAIRANRSCLSLRLPTPDVHFGGIAFIIENSNSLSNSPPCCSVFVVVIRLVSRVKVVVQSGIR